MIVTSPAASSSVAPRRLEPVVVLVALVAFGSALVGLGGHATYGATVSGDEPFYLLTTGSIVRGEGLDIGAAMDRGDFREYHPIDLNQQSRVLGDGRRLSPHDPLLPLLAAPAYALAPSVGLQGWQGVKILLALLGGLAGGVTAWVAMTRLSSRPSVVAIVVGGAFCGLPLSAYGSQVYPEVPAALVVILAVAVLTGPSLTGSVPSASPQSAPRPAEPGLSVSGLAEPGLSVPGQRPAGVRAFAVLLLCVALPWLSVKYVLVAAALGGILLSRVWRIWGGRGVVWLVLGATACAGAYVVAHLAWYGGWTVYAVGDHFAQTGELSVVGESPDYLGRARRLIGLVVDNRFGIGVWSPVWLLLPAGVTWLWRSRSAHRAVLLGPLLAGWLVATFVALTMHGWWVPGRQLVVVLPLGAVAIAGLVSDRAPLRVFAGAAAFAGAVNWVWLAIETSGDSRALIVDFFQTSALPYRWVAALAPGGMPSEVTAWTPVVMTAWALGLVASAWLLGRPAKGLHRPSTDETAGTDAESNEPNAVVRA